MKALIFAAGLGTRLRPLTDNMPKALVPLNGTPMLEHVIKNIIACGITDIVVNVHHFGDKIIQFLKEKNNFGVNITISDERDLLLDTGGGILKAADLLGDEPFLVHNADIYTDIDLRTIINEHTRNNADITLLVKERSTQRYIVFNENYRMIGWTNIATGEVKPTTLDLTAPHHKCAFGGIHIINPSIFKHLKEYAAEPKFSIMPFYISTCSDLKIYGYNPSGYNWFDIGKLETLKAAEEHLQSK